MTDTTELKRLAEALIAATDAYTADECNDYLATNWAVADDTYQKATLPETVLALIAENEKLKADLREVKDAKLGLSWAIGEIMGERDQLKAERDEFMESQGRRLDVLRDEHRVERDRLRAEIAGLKTGYEAYERVNAELKAENEMLKRDSEKSFANGRNRGLDEASNLCYRLALAQYRPEGSRYTLFIPKAHKALGDVLVGACNLIADLPDGPLRRHRERQERKAALGKGEQS